MASLPAPGTPLARLDGTAWLALAYLGLLASVVVVILQAWGQQRVDAMRSAIVFGLSLCLRR